VAFDSVAAAKPETKGPASQVTIMAGLLIALDAIERIARVLSIAAIPVVLAIGGWIIQRQLQNQTVSRDYVQLALTILQSPDQSKVPPELREWAVDLLNDNSPTKLNAKAMANLKSGAVTLPSFRFVPSSELTPELKTELESTLTSFRSYMGEFGFSVGTRPVSVEVAPGVEYEGFVASWNPDTASIVVASAFKRDKASVLRQLAHQSLHSRSIQSPEYLAIESGLATYFPCSFLEHPKLGDQASAAGQNIFRPQDLLNSRRFSEIQLDQFVSVQNDGSEIWGAAFWQIRKLLGKKDADRLLAKTWQAFGPRDSQTASFYASFVESLVESSKGVSDGSQAKAVRAIFVGRGIDSPRGANSPTTP
jgi:hypothetical protein